jgi:predicted permease
MIAGAVLRKVGLVKKEHDEGAMRLIFNVMFPCLILDKVLGNEVVRSGPVVAWAIGIGFTFIAGGIALGYFTGRVLGLKRGTGLHTFALSSGCQNFGFTAAPVVEILWGGGALALLFVHNIGVEVAIWSVGMMVISGGTGIPWRQMINGPIVAVVIAMVLVALGLDDNITGPPRQAISMIGIGSFPLAIFITGCTIMDLIGHEKPTLRIIVGSSLVRLGLVPAAMLCAAKFLPLATEIRQVLIVQAAMPAAFTPILMARLYGGRPGMAVQVVLATTILSLITLPWIITIGTEWIGLEPLLP